MDFIEGMGQTGRYCETVFIRLCLALTVCQPIQDLRVKMLTTRHPIIPTRGLGALNGVIGRISYSSMRKEISRKKSAMRNRIPVSFVTEVV